MSAWTRVAQVAKAKNPSGSVVCQAADGLPFLLEPGMEVNFVPPTLEGPHKAQVKSVEPIDDGRKYNVRFSGISSLDQSSSISQCWCLVRTEDLPEFERQQRLADLEGYEVVDEAHGALGIIDFTYEDDFQGRIEVKGPLGRVIIPFVDEFVTSVDDDQRVVGTSVPDGLIGLDDSND